MTIQQHASFGAKDAGLNATSKANPALTKLVQMWENNNAKRAIKGSGVSLMALSLTACGGSDDVAVDITSDNAAAILTAITAVDAAATTIQGVADNAADAEAASTLAAINSATGLSLTDASTGAEVIAAIQGTVDITTDNAALIAAAEAAVDITTDNAVLIAAAEAAATTAALTATDLTVYANVDAAKTAGLTTTSAAAVTAALTDASLVVHATVDAAITSNDAAITAAETIAATAAAEATLVSGTGFATVAALSAAYTAAIGATSALSSTLSTGNDSVFGTVNNDTITGTLTTYTAGDIITDGTATDSDVMNITSADDIALLPVVSGIENINFTVTSVGAGGTLPATFTVNAANINSSIITGVASHASTVVDTFLVSNLKTDMTVSSAIATVNVGTVADADVTVNLTGASGTVINSGTTDTLTVTGGNVTSSSATAEEAVTITATGTVTINDTAANAAGTDVAYTIVSGDDVSIAAIADSGSLNVTANGGDVALVAAGIDGILTAVTAAGDITVDADAATTLTLTAVGAGPADTGTASDGAIIVTTADAVTTAVLTSTDSITISDMDAATSITLSAAAASSIISTGVTTLSLASTSTAATAVAYTMASGSGVVMKTVTATGDNNVTLTMLGANLVSAEAAGSAAALVATDSGTGTSRLDISGATGAALDLSGVAFDEIEMGFDNAASALTMATNQQMVVSANQTNLTLTAAAVAGNTLGIRLDSATVGTGVTLTDLSTTNLATINITMADDTTATHTITDMGVGATTNVTIAGNGGLAFGAIGTAQVVNSVNASSVTGDIVANVVMAGTFTAGSGDDTLNISDAVSSTRVIDGGAGADSLVFAASDNFEAQSLTVTNVETFNVAASGVILSGAQVTGQGYAFVGNAIGDTLAINVQAGTGETVDISSSQIVLATVTLTGAGGADNLIGSATQATTFAGGAGSDVITGGAGADIVTFIFHATEADTITLGGGSDIVKASTATPATIAAVTIRDFNAGTVTTNVDALQLSDAGLQGLNTTTDMVDSSGASADIATAGVIKHVTTDGGTITVADLVVLSQGYATDTLALAGIKTAGSDTITFGAALADNDSFLVAYQDGADTNIAVVTASATAATSQLTDTLVTIVTLEGVSAADLNTNDFTFIA